MGRHPRIPLPLFLIMELQLWLRWVLFPCWRSCWRAVKLRGKAVAEQEGLGRLAQLEYLLYLGLCHCIPPAEVHAFRLYRDKSKQEFWDYVFIHEIQAFHRRPLLDVCLVRLFPDIPSEENFHRGIGRYLHRRAIDGVVPDTITSRLSSAIRRTTKGFSTITISGRRWS